MPTTTTYTAKIRKATSEELLALANSLLQKSGFEKDGSKKGEKKKSQIFFERRILMTPMGNGMR